MSLRVRAVYKDANGVLEQVFSAPTAPVANVNDPADGRADDQRHDADRGSGADGGLLTGIADPDGMTTALDAGAFTFQWQSSRGSASRGPIVGDGTQLFTPTQAQVGLLLRVVGDVRRRRRHAGDGDLGGHRRGRRPHLRLNAANTLPARRQDELIGTAAPTPSTDCRQRPLDGGAGNDTHRRRRRRRHHDRRARQRHLRRRQCRRHRASRDPGEGTDTVQHHARQPTRWTANVENLTFIGAGSFTGTGNGAQQHHHRQRRRRHAERRSGQRHAHRQCRRRHAERRGRQRHPQRWRRQRHPDRRRRQRHRQRRRRRRPVRSDDRRRQRHLQRRRRHRHLRPVRHHRRCQRSRHGSASSSADAATTRWPASRTSSAARATTSSPSTAAPTSSMARAATTRSTLAEATTSSAAAPATTR